MAVPKSLAFAIAPPPFVYQNVVFEAQVNLIDEHKNKVLGVSKTLCATLRYHDTYDVVADQTMIMTDTVQVDPHSGVCQLRCVLKTLTASLDGRAFCIEVRSIEGDIESVFSSSVTVIKEKLRIVQQPPDVWFKDEGGREKCMHVMLVLDPAPGMPLENRVVPLELRLLYESGQLVANQQILRLFPDMRPNMTNGQVTIAFRIDDVSKNHQGQSFVLEIAPEKQEKSSMFQDIAPVRTSVIAIRSKRNKRKLQASGTRVSPRNFVGTPRNASHMMMMNPTHSPMMSPTNSSGGSGPGTPAHGSLHPHHQQRPNQLMNTPMNNQYGMRPHMPIPNGPPSMSWSHHAHAPTPMHHPHQMPVPTPTHSSNVTSAPSVVEWKLAGFEVHPDGTQNVGRPIYRCPSCNRLNDVDQMNSGMPEHGASCVFGSMLASQPPMMNSSTPRQLLVPPSTSSPKANRFVGPNHHRPMISISPFMGKANSNQDGVDNALTTGNLFASNSFKNHMEMDATQRDEKPQLADLETPEPPSESPQPPQPNVNSSNSLLFTEMSSMGISITGLNDMNTANMLSNPIDEPLNPLADLMSGPPSLNTQQDDESKVFYILARMYTNAQNEKLGLPAFDQYQRMLGFYVESQQHAQTQVVFHPLHNFVVSDKEQQEMTQLFAQELEQQSNAVHSLPKYQHNLILLREDALMYYWSQSLMQ